MSDNCQKETKEENIRLYCAPMEGITGYVFRNVYHRLFGGIDKYFSPFLSPMQKRRLKTRDKKDVDPVNNQGYSLVPQVLTNHAEQFLETVEYLEGLGYSEVNLNLGCPSPTVVTKGKGAGFLADPDVLEEFFQEVFDGLEEQRSKVRISVKSRLGMYDPDEMIRLLEIYQSYPIVELILHPRIQRDLYKNPVSLEAFDRVYENCKIPLCYNGDIFSAEDYSVLQQRFPKLRRWMLGRGLVAAPELSDAILQKEETGDFREPSEKRFAGYVNELYQAYIAALGNKQDAMYHMKEIWALREQLFREENPEIKKIRKDLIVWNIKIYYCYKRKQKNL